MEASGIVWGFIAAGVFALGVMLVAFTYVFVKTFWVLILLGLAAVVAVKIVGSYRRQRDDTYGMPPQF